MIQILIVSKVYSPNLTYNKFKVLKHKYIILYNLMMISAK